jgi:hypothetical protein
MVASGYVVYVGLLAGLGAAGGLYTHCATARLGFDEEVGQCPAKGLLARVLRLDLDETGGRDILSYRNMLAMAVAGAALPLLAGLALWPLVAA